MKKILTFVVSMLLTVGVLGSCYLLEEDISERISVGMDNQAFLEIAEEQREYYQMGPYCFFKNCGKDYVVVIDYTAGTVQEIRSYPSVTPTNKNFEELQVGDDIFAVVDKVGVPEGSYTSGAISLTYKLRNGDVYTIYFNSSSEMTVMDIVYEPATVESSNGQSGSVGADDSSTNSLNGEVKTFTMTAAMDYMHIEGQATLLLNGCNVFFNTYEYGIETLVAGDILEISYVGEFIVQETYPGTVMTQYFTIQDVTIQEAFFIPITVAERDGGGLCYVVTIGDYTITKFASSNIISIDGTFRTPTEADIGTTLYASCKGFRKNYKNVQIEAIYDYYPREEEKDHMCSLVCLEETLPTCQEEGVSVIGCTYCGWEFERTVLPKIACEYDEYGVCSMCGEEKTEIQPCCFCGSYTCTGCVEE